jgi:DNA invertase Pin-like site-specific DNA recombinase
MLVGYMRVSSADDRQSVDLQRDALLAAGVDARHLFADKASGARDDRPGLQACLDYLRPGGGLVVWKLVRLGRSLPHLLAIVTDLKGRGIAFRSLTKQMDTTTLLFSIFGALAQYERALTRERVMAGLAAARRRGRRGGTPACTQPGAGRADHPRTGQRCQQGLGLPELQGAALHADRYAQEGGMERGGEGLSRKS